MQFIAESKAIMKQNEIAVTAIRPSTFEFVQKVLREANYDIKVPPRVNTSVLKDVLEESLYLNLKDIDMKYLNELYRAVHFMKIPSMRRCLAAVIACKVYFDKTPSAYA